jgi:hypothetical protein
MNPAPFFYWLNERHRIWIKRNNGMPKPWTDDPILRRYRFCNVFRELDKVTIWVRRNIREKHKDSPDLWHRLFVARFINWPETLEELLGLDWYSNGQFQWQALAKQMKERGARGDQVWTNAYTVSTNGVPIDKPTYICRDVLNTAWLNRIEFERAAHTSLKEFCDTVQKIDGIGGFMAYEVACDLRWSPGWLDKAPDRLTWANTGPGAKRGLNRLHGRKLEQSISEKQAVAEMQQLLELAPIYAGEHIVLDRLEMREIEHSLCETDKYLRVQNGEGKPRSTFQGV